MTPKEDKYWQIYKKGTYDALGHFIGIIPEGFKTPAYSKLIEVFKGSQEEAIKRAEVIERTMQMHE